MFLKCLITFHHKIIIYSGNIQQFKHMANKEFIWWKYALPITYLHYDDNIIYILISKSLVAQCHHHSSVIPIINKYLSLICKYATEIIYNN